MRSTNKIHSLWIMIKSTVVTVHFSTICLYQAYRQKAPEEINHSIRSWAKGLLSAIKLSYRVYNPHDVTPTPHKAWVIMSNHASLYDIPLIFMALPGNIRMVAKKELFKVPVWGHAMKATKFIAIDRQNSAQAMEDLKLAKKQMEEDSVIPWIAPEGTRSRDGKLGVFKKGGFMLALQTNATIIPVGIRGSGKILPPDTFNFNLDEEVEIHIGEPIDTSEYSIKTRNELVKRVRDEIKALADAEG